MNRSGWTTVAALVFTALTAAAAGLAAAGEPGMSSASPAEAKAAPVTKAKRKAAAAPTDGPLWDSLGEPARNLLQPFAAQWNSWSPHERRIWVSLAAKFPKLSADKQAKVRTRIVEWADLTPEQRKLARANFRLARQLPSEERVSQWQRYESMTPEQRKVLRIGGRTSNTAAKHAGARTGLAKQAATPLGEIEAVWPENGPP